MENNEGKLLNKRSKGVRSEINWQTVESEKEERNDWRMQVAVEMDSMDLRRK